MISINIIIGVIIAGILIFAMFLLLTSPDQKAKQKKQKEEKEAEDKQKRLEEKSSRLDKALHSLREKIASLENTILEKDKEILEEKASIKKYQERVAQEHKWLEKEQSDLDKKDKQIHQLQEEFKKSQESYSNEHSLTLRLQRDVKEFEQKMDASTEQRRIAEAQNAQLKAQIENYLAQIASLKQQNAELTKKKEDTAWVSKTDYMALEQRLREKEGQLNRLLRETQIKKNNTSENA
ncbi:MAG: hypothetical protein HQL24_08230 [Candidatus Omnitrophica bacterium]|nr:hypothetical protein [Candidatus Omnitrophota bacterium]